MYNLNYDLLFILYILMLYDGSGVVGGVASVQYFVSFDNRMQRNRDGDHLSRVNSYSQVPQ